MSSLSDKAVIRLSKENKKLEKQLKHPAREMQKHYRDSWKEAENKLEGMKNAYDELNDGRKIWIARALKAEKQLEDMTLARDEIQKMHDITIRQLEAVRDLHSFSVPYAPLGEKAVWVSDIEAALKESE